MTVRCKRNYSNYTLPYKSAPVSKQKPAILTATLNQEQNPKKERHLHENVYIYREGMVPPSRQMFYQVIVNSFLCSIDNENTWFHIINKIVIFIYFVIIVLRRFNRRNTRNVGKAP